MRRRHQRRLIDARLARRCGTAPRSPLAWPSPKSQRCAAIGSFCLRRHRRHEREGQRDRSSPPRPRSPSAATGRRCSRRDADRHRSRQRDAAVVAQPGLRQVEAGQRVVVVGRLLRHRQRDRVAVAEEHEVLGDRAGARVRGVEADDERRRARRRRRRRGARSAQPRERRQRTRAEARAKTSSQTQHRAAFEPERSDDVKRRV